MTSLRIEKWDRDEPDDEPTVAWEAEVPDVDLGDVLVVDGQRYVMDLVFLVAVGDDGNPVRENDEEESGGGVVSARWLHGLEED